MISLPRSWSAQLRITPSQTCSRNVTGLPMLNVRQLAQPLEQRHPGQRREGRPWDVQEHEPTDEERHRQRARHQTLPSAPTDEQDEAGDGDAEEESEQGPTGARQHQDRELKDQQRAEEHQSERARRRLVGRARDGRTGDRPGDPPWDECPPRRRPPRGRVRRWPGFREPRESRRLPGSRRSRISARRPSDTRAHILITRSRPIGGRGPPLAPGRFETRPRQRDQDREIATERNVLPERRPHGETRDRRIPGARKGIPTRRLAEREQTDRRAAEQRRVDEIAHGLARFDTPLARRRRARWPRPSRRGPSRGRSCRRGSGPGRRR